MTSDANAVKRIHLELAARTEATTSARRAFLETIANSDDTDAIVDAARKELEARGELAALKLAAEQITNVAEATRYGIEIGDLRSGRGARGKIEAAKRFKKPVK